MITRVENEIIELHQFFQDWYNNNLSISEETFTRVSDVLAPEFCIIFPSGENLSYQVLLDNLRKAHNTQNDIRIWIQNIQVQFHIGELILATYQEWQKIGGKTTSRLSSVVFRVNGTKPNGLQWLHVHETWINP
jgi:hypothetical protein